MWLRPIKSIPGGLIRPPDRAPGEKKTKVSKIGVKKNDKKKKKRK